MLFGYDAVADDKKRQSPSNKTRSEDKALDRSDRRKAINRVRELWRSFAAARWMLNKHCDFVASIHFQSRNEDEVKATSKAAKAELARLDERIEELVAWWARPHNFHASGRHGLYRSLRIAEACRVSDGDMLFQQLSNGKVATIEGDRLRTPSMGGSDPRLRKGTWTHGIQVHDRTGQPLRYAICDRVGSQGFTLRAIIPARHIVHHAWWDFRFDQVRGVSPFLAAVPDLIDAKEAKGYALSRMKISQFVGLLVKRASDEPLGTVEGEGETDTEKPFTVNLGQSPFLLDFTDEDDAQWLETSTPSSEFTTFWQVVLAGGMKTLDLPWSFYDEAYTNFFGSRAALNIYLASAVRKREDVAETADRLFRWRMGLFLLEGELTLPRYLSIPELRGEWMPTGLPWWNPIQEVKADKMAVEMGTATVPGICKARGDEARDLVEQQLSFESYRRRRYAEESVPLPGEAPPLPAREPAGDVYGPES